jgi:hypothetical protein
MSPLGVTINTRNAPPGRGAFSETDTLFVAGTWSAGPTTNAVLVRSMADVEAAFATRTSNTVIWDYLDTFFREGGRRAWVLRYTAGAGAMATAINTLFGPDLGPGQVAAPNETPNATTYAALADHAAANNRVALLDVANNDTVGAMTTLGGSAVALTNKTYAALFGPWVNVPPPAGVVGGSARQVQASAVVAGLIARADALGNPNRAAAGRDFPLQYATSFVRDVTAAERETLLNAGVNQFANRYGILQLYGFQSGEAANVITPYWQFNCARARMWLKARAAEVGENYMFRPLDGRGRLAGALKTDLDAVCLELYGLDGLYGDTPDDAFSVEVGSSVNTVPTIAQGELHAVVEVRLSLHAKSVIIDLVSVPVTGTVTQPA